MERQAFIEQLRQVADFLDAHENVPTPAYGPTFNVYLTGDDAQEQLREAIEGTGLWAKGYIGGTFYLRKRFGGPVESVFDAHFDINCDRDEVCTRRVVGTELVTVPAVEAREAQPERTEEREIVEWDCEPILKQQATA